MSFRKAIPLLVLAPILFSSGCMNEKLGSRTLLTPESDTELGQACAQLGALGSVASLTAHMNADVNQIISLSNRVSSETDARVKTLVDDITAKVQALKASSQPEYTVEKWPTQMSWSFGPADLALVGSSCEVSEKTYLSAEVETVYVDGFKRDDLTSHVHTTLEAQAISFKLELAQSSLSLCEFQNVTGLEVKITFQACGQKDWREYRLGLENMESDQ